jgi:hypothetical protein
VRHVNVCAGHFCNRHVALDPDRFSGVRNALDPEHRGNGPLVRRSSGLQRRVLAMIDDRNVEHRGVFQRAAHQQRRRDRPAIVGDGDAAGVSQVADFRQLFAVLPNRDGANRIDARDAHVGRALQDELRDRRVVVDRVRVRHAGHGREAARHRRLRARRDRLFVFLPRLAQMDVNVDQPGRDDTTRRQFHDLSRTGRQVAADARDAAVLDQDVEFSVAARNRIDHVNVLQQQRRHPSSPASK